MPTCACGAPIPASRCKAAIFPNPPPSVGLILSRAQAAQGLWLPRGSKIDELEIPTGDIVVSGSKTVPVEVKE